MNLAMTNIPIRVKLDLTQAHLRDSNTKFVWFPVDRSVKKTIADLKLDICNAFGARTKHVQLFLEECLIRDEDTVLLLRENDVIQVKYMKKRKSDYYENDSTKKFRAKSSNHDYIKAVDLVEDSPTTDVPKENERCGSRIKYKLSFQNSKTNTSLNSSKESIKKAFSENEKSEVKDSSFQKSKLISETDADVSVVTKKKRRQRRRKRKSIGDKSVDNSFDTIEPQISKLSHLNLRRKHLLSFSVFPIKNCLVADSPNENTRHIKFENSETLKNTPRSSTPQPNRSTIYIDPKPKVPSINGKVSAATEHNESNIVEPHLQLSDSVSCTATPIDNPVEIAMEVETDPSQNIHKPLPKDTQCEKKIASDYNRYNQCAPVNTFPHVGSVIAFKVLELSESYCPEVSEFKEGKVIDATNDILTIELLKAEIKKHDGKFDNIYEDDDNSSVYEFVKKVKLPWSSLIEPKFISFPTL